MQRKIHPLGETAATIPVSVPDTVTISIVHGLQRAVLGAIGIGIQGLSDLVTVSIGGDGGHTVFLAQGIPVSIGGGIAAFSSCLHTLQHTCKQISEISLKSLN